MTASPAARLRLSVLGCSSAAPHPDWPAAGFLVDYDGTAVMLDAGQGTIRRLQRLMDPTTLDALVIGHLHADHYLDVVGLRYLFPWGAPAPRPLPVHLPPGGRARFDALATAISERERFFDPAFDMVEYDPSTPLRIGPLTFRFVRGRHYVPAWGLVVESPDGARIAYTGDTGPSEAVVEALHGADLLLVEAALTSTKDDDPERGHLMPEEAIELAERSGARSALIVHYPPARRQHIEDLCSAAGSWIRPAVAGQTVTVDPRTADDRAAYGTSAAPSAAAARER